MPDRGKQKRKLWKALIAAIIVAIVVVSAGIGWLIWRNATVEKLTNVNKRNVPSSTEDKCLTTWKGLELNYTRGGNFTYQVDLCDIIQCSGHHSSWRGFDVYMCRFLWGIPTNNPWCPRWSDVIHYTNPYYQYAHTNRDKWGIFYGGISMVRGQVSYVSSQSNPIIINLSNILTNPYGTYPTTSCTGNPTYSNKTVFLVIGVDVTGTDPMGLLKINIQDPEKQTSANNNNTGVKLNLPKQDSKVIVHNTDKITSKQQLTIETGFTEGNTWLDRARLDAELTNQTNCVICKKARQRFGLVPTNLETNNNGTNQTGYDGTCILDIMTQDNPSSACQGWDKIYPVITTSQYPPTFQVGPVSNVTCILNNDPSSNSIQLGKLTECNNEENITGKAIAGKLQVARADIWWYCGKRTLWEKLPTKWQGTCALVSLVSPVTVFAEKDLELLVKEYPQSDYKSHYRRKRSRFIGDDSLQGVWIDAIGQARGIPDEYKLVDEIATGFENLPIISAMFPITANKNTNRINLLHYNAQRLANYTRDSVAAIHEQLSQTSLMAVQTRQAVDMLLAEKGGVCAMFGDNCCTFISNHTAPDGKLTRSLEKLKSLAIEMKNQSGVSNPLADWLDKTFGKWGKYLAMIGASIICCLTLLALCGCCCIPCIRSLMERTIERAFTDTRRPPPYSPKSSQMVLEDLEANVALLDVDLDEPTDMVGNALSML